MCQLCCSVCTFQQFLTSHGPRKQRGSYFWGFYVRLHSDCGVIPQNRQLTALQKGHFRAQHAFIPLPSQKKKKRRNQTRAAGWKPPKLINYRCISFLPGAFSGWFMNFNSLCPHHWLPKLSITKSWDQMHILFFFSPHFFNSLAVSLLNFNTAVFLYRCTSSQTSTSI